LAINWFEKNCLFYASEEGEHILGQSAFLWLKQSFASLSMLPPDFSPTKITLILNCKYPAFLKKEGLRLVRLAKKLNKNLIFKAGKILLPNAIDTVYIRGNCGPKGKGATLLLAKRCIYKHIKNGVEFCGIQNLYIDAQVEIGKGAIICAPCRICGKSKIDGGAYVGAGSQITNSHICSSAQIINSVVADSVVFCGASVGPYAHIRKNCKVGENCRVGDFVEIKNSSLAQGVKVAHLAYIGDAVIGRCVNVGCGVVFANYDGKNKHISVVEDNAFIGCNCNIVAPACIKKGAYIAAGTTVCSDVDVNALCVGRVKQTVIQGGALGRYKNG